MRTTVDATILYKGKRYTYLTHHIQDSNKSIYIFFIDGCTVVVEHDRGGTATLTTIKGNYTLEEINNMNLYHKEHRADFAIDEEEVDEYVTKHINNIYKLTF